MKNKTPKLCLGIVVFLTSMAAAYALPSTWNTNGHRVFVFDPKSHTWAAYNQSGHRVNSGRASGGKPYCPDIHRGCRTIVGTFTVFSKGGPGCKSTRFPRPYGGAPMPYCMHFNAKGYAIHGSNDVPNANASHGCIRVPPSQAYWLSRNFVTIGTRVVVLPYGSGGDYSRSYSHKKHSHHRYYQQQNDNEQDYIDY